MFKIRFFKYSILIILLVIPLVSANIAKAQVIFEDDFETGNLWDKWNYISGIWNKEVFSNSTWVYTNSASGSDNEIQSKDSGSWNNYEFSLNVYRVSGSDINLFFRIQQGQRYASPFGHNLPVSYGLHLKNGRFALQKFLQSSGSEIGNIANIPFPPASAKRIRIRLSANNIKIYSDNEATPVIDYTDNNNPFLSGGVALAAITGGDPSYVRYDNIRICPLDDPACSIIIPPPTTTKVFFVPGLGASWNANAFANCTFDNNTANWSLASYAEDIYNPLLTALNQRGWDTKPFYYDWKNQVQNNSNTFSNFVSASNLLPDEKINIVSHSMGGLVGMNYSLQNPSLVDRLSAAGSPFKGSVLSYPAWEGGDIWNDNFLIKIATTLFLKHCGSVLNTPTDKETIHQAFPSIGNLLPTFNYLTDFKTGQSISPLYAINTWLKINFTIPSGPKIQTLSGAGFNTLSSLSTKPANKREALNELWQDGKPTGKIYTVEGDGTVLSSSSSLNTLNSLTINQTHSGLVVSQEGINAILDFLGPSPNTLNPQPSLNTSFSEPGSALIIIGYPANFVVIDQNGNGRKDSNGMASFINPKSENYKLNLFPKSNNTLLVVAQFLPNGEVKYKEYNLQGLGPKFKNLNFSLENPQKDILN